MYSPTIIDWSMFIGTIGFFFTLIYLFLRFLPMISIFEVRTLLPQAQVAHSGHGDPHDEPFVEGVNEAPSRERGGKLET
jgi:molybdopterin-containing oxidoreductase family membrane subunit